MPAFLQFKLPPARVLAPTQPGHRMLWQKLHHFLPVQEALGNYGLCFGCSSQNTSHSFYGCWLLWLHFCNSSCLQLECWPPPSLDTGCFGNRCITLFLCMKLWETMACVLAARTKAQAIASMAGGCYWWLLWLQFINCSCLQLECLHHPAWTQGVLSAVHQFAPLHEAMGSYGLCCGCSSQNTSHSFYGWWLLWLLLEIELLPSRVLAPTHLTLCHEAMACVAALAWVWPLKLKFRIGLERHDSPGCLGPPSVCHEIAGSGVHVSCALLLWQWRRSCHLWKHLGAWTSHRVKVMNLVASNFLSRLQPLLMLVKGPTSLMKGVQSGSMPGSIPFAALGQTLAGSWGGTWLKYKQPSTNFKCQWRSYIIEGPSKLKVGLCSGQTILLKAEASLYYSCGQWKTGLWKPRPNFRPCISFRTWLWRLSL